MALKKSILKSSAFPSDLSQKSPLIFFGDRNSKDLECPNAYVGSLSRLVKSEISLLKTTANSCRTASLSANQMGSSHNMFAIRQNIKDNQWTYSNSGYYSIYINPTIIKTYEVFYFIEINK